MEKARLGIVGLGWFGDVLARAAVGSGSAEVVSCFARSPDTREAFAQTHGCRAASSFEELLGEVDGVVLATPHSTHADQIERAAAEGTHVFVEKPLALTVEDAHRAIEAAERAGVTLQVGFNRRRHPAIRRIKRMIDGGDLGTLLQMEGFHAAAGGFKPDLPAWRSDPAECPAGGMTPLGIHTIDTFHYWAGPAERVAAFSTKIGGLSTLDQATTVIVEYGGGVLGSINTSYFTAPVVTLAAYGTETSAWSEEDGTRLFLQPRTERARSEHDIDVLDTFADEMREFARCILHGERPETGGAEGLEAVVVLEAALRSIQTGRAVDLADVR